jgi:hypothetical protein
MDSTTTGRAVQLSTAEAVARYRGNAPPLLAAQFERAARQLIREGDRALARAAFRASRSALRPVPRRAPRPRTSRRVRSVSRRAAVSAAGDGAPSSSDPPIAVVAPRAVKAGAP